MKPLVGGSLPAKARRREESDLVAVDHVTEAIRALPSSLTKDYYIALDHCPDVVMTETNPLKFFRCEQGNSWAAALRLVQNWSLRRQVFGEDYWLKPTRLKDGALHPKDIALLRTGACVLLTPPDPQQRQIFIADFGRLQGLEEGTARQRIMFYIMVHGLNEYTQRHGIDALVIVNGRGMKVRSDNGHILQATHTKTAFFMHRFFLVRDPTDQRMTLKHLFEKMMLNMVQKFWGNKLITVAEDSPSHTRKALEQQGIHTSTIPTQLGGDWTYDYIDQWLTQRLHIEGAASSIPRDLPLCSHGSVPSKNIELPENPPQKSQTPSDMKSAVQVPRKRRRKSEVSQGSGGRETWDDEKLQDAREKSAFYSRRSYYRKKEERNELASKRDQLEEEKEILRKEGQRLECLLDQAKTVLSSNLSFSSTSDYFMSYLRQSSK